MHQAISTILVVPGIFVIQGHPRQSRRITAVDLGTPARLLATVYVRSSVVVCLGWDGRLP